MSVRLSLSPNSGAGRGQVQFAVVVPPSSLSVAGLSAVAAAKFRKKGPCRLFATRSTPGWPEGCEITDSNAPTLTNDMVLSVAFKGQDFVFSDGRSARPVAPALTIPPPPVRGCGTDIPQPAAADVVPAVPAAAPVESLVDAQMPHIDDEAETEFFPLLRGNVLPSLRAAIAGADIFFEKRRDGFIAFDYQSMHSSQASFLDPKLLKGPHRRAALLRRECRGLLVDEISGEVVARRFPKFFNLYEHDETLALADTPAADLLLTNKLDGSLVTPFRFSVASTAVRWATKTTICAAVEQFVASRPVWHAFAVHWLSHGYTPLLEWCEAGKTPGVISVSTSSLTLLAVRHMTTGVFVERAVLEANAAFFDVPLVPCRPLHSFGCSSTATLAEVAAAVRLEMNCEGVVVQFPHSGTLLKIKTLWYVALSTSTKDGGGDPASILANLLHQRPTLASVPARAVWTACLADAADDVIATCCARLQTAGQPSHAAALRAFKQALEEKLQHVCRGMLAWAADLQALVDRGDLAKKDLFQAAAQVAHSHGWPTALASAFLHGNAAQGLLELKKHVRNHAQKDHLAPLGITLGLTWDLSSLPAAPAPAAPLPATPPVDSLQVFCDLDGVLADFEKGFSSMTGTALASQSEMAVWGKIMSVFDFFLKLEPCDGALELWEALLNFGNKTPCILSGLPAGKFGKKVAKQKKAWAEKYIPGFSAVHVCMSADKHQFCRGPGHVLIDDRISLKSAWESQGGIFLHHCSVAQTLAKLKFLGDPAADAAVAASVLTTSAADFDFDFDFVAAGPSVHVQSMADLPPLATHVAIVLVDDVAFLAVDTAVYSVSLVSADSAEATALLAMLADANVVKIGRDIDDGDGDGDGNFHLMIAELCQRLVLLLGSSTPSMSVKSVLDLGAVLPAGLFDLSLPPARRAQHLVHCYQSVVARGPQFAEWCLSKLETVPDVLAVAASRPGGRRTVAYTAITLDGESRTRLLQTFPPQFARTLGTHVTLAFNPRARHLRHLPAAGTVCSVTVVGPALDDQHVQAVKVTSISPLLPPSVFDERPLHITLSVRPGVAPARANALLTHSLPLREREAGELHLTGVVSIHRHAPSSAHALDLFEEVQRGLEPDVAPVLCILRGLPGSGKSTLAAKLCGVNRGVVHISADHFFESGAGVLNKRDSKGLTPLQVYAACFDVSLLPRAHEFAQRACERAVREENSKLVIVDNCNIRARDLAPYVAMALAHERRVLVLELPHPPRDTQGSHNVPLADLQRMRANWEVLVDDDKRPVHRLDSLLA